MDWGRFKGGPASEVATAVPAGRLDFLGERITTLQHSELWRDALTLFMSEKPALVRPAWTRLIGEWLTRPATREKA